jgi:hypothetical protein
MRIPSAFGSAFLAFVLAGPAHAVDCGTLKLVSEVQMTRDESGESDLVPVKLNGQAAFLQFQTASWVTVLPRKLVDDLKLPTYHGNYTVYDSAGNISTENASVKQFLFADMQAKDAHFPISDFGERAYGTLGTNFLTSFDIDVDFGTDKMKLFSPDHCPSGVVYWTNPATVAILPITLYNNAVTVPVTVDGHDMKAYIRSEGQTLMRKETAESFFGLTMGSPDTPELEGQTIPKGKEREKTYMHVFKNLTFGGITVNNARVHIYPDVLHRFGDTAQQTGNRALLNNDHSGPAYIAIGMNVLRKLHVYFAFGEQKMYISAASPASTPAATAQ